MYILSPLLKKLVDSLNRSLAGYMLILWLIFSSVLPTIAVFVPENYKSFFTLNNDFNLNFIGGYLGYFLLGYYLFKLDKKLSKKLLIIIIVIDTAIISLGTWYFTLKLGTYPEHFLSYPKIFMLVLSASVFLLVKELLSDKHLHGPVLSIINFLASISFGVYLLHNLIVDFISNIINLWPASSLFNLVLCYFIVLIASFLCIIVLASFKPTCFIFTGLTYDAACKTCNIQFLIRSTVKKLDTARNK